LNREKLSLQILYPHGAPARNVTATKDDGDRCRPQRISTPAEIIAAGPITPQPPRDRSICSRTKGGSISPQPTATAIAKKYGCRSTPPAAATHRSIGSRTMGVGLTISAAGSDTSRKIIAVGPYPLYPPRRRGTGPDKRTMGVGSMVMITIGDRLDNIGQLTHPHQGKFSL